MNLLKEICCDAVRGNPVKFAYVALMCPSGSGKSTLLNLVAGLDVPDGGNLDRHVLLRDPRGHHRIIIRIAPA